LIKTAEVVQSENVVGMSVSNKAGVNAANIVLQALKPQFRRGIDEYIETIQSYHGTGAGPPVTRVVAAADRAIAGNKRNALTGAGT